MTAIQIATFNPPARGVLAFVLGDIVDLTPTDGRFSYSYAITTKPEGSSATFTGAAFTPDLAGEYVCTVTAGADVLTVPAFVFAASVYNGLAPSAGYAYSDAEKRSMLTGLANGGITAAGLAAWNAGTVPAGLNLLQFGGR